MKTCRLATMVIWFLSLLILNAQQTLDTKEPRWKQLSQAYGFVSGQQTSLVAISKKFPDLGQSAKEAWFAFNSTALGEGAKGAEAELALFFKDKWPESKAKVESQLDALSKTQEVTREQAVAFLEEVRQRAKGKMQETILATLLSAHPGLVKDPVLELTGGWRQTFQTKDHPKAKGQDFSVAFPLSWMKREGNGPNVVQVFQSGAGHGTVMGTLMVKTLPLPADYKPSEEELKGFFQPSELKGMVPDKGTLVEAKEIVLANAPAGLIVSDHVTKRLDMEITTRMTQFITIHDSSMVIIQFGTAVLPGSADTLDDLQKKWLPAFKVMANSLRWNDRFK